jgi:hypothetical protein
MTVKRSALAVLGLVVALCFVVSAPKTASAQSPATVPGTALVYGDSLTWESSDKIQDANSAVIVRSYPTTAPCQWDTWLPADLALYHPTVVGIVSAGNTCGSEIMGSSEYYTDYWNSLKIMFADATAAGARVVFFISPPMLDPVRQTAVNWIYLIAEVLAAQYPGVSISNAVSTALATIYGTYASTLPCLSTEGAAKGCVNGQIDVRTVVGPQTGLHLCADGLTATYPWPCATYSSGELRFGRAVAHGLS